MNDTGRLGPVTRGLLAMQDKLMRDLPLSAVGREPRYYTTLRQLTFLKGHDIELMDHGAVLQTSTSRLWPAGGIGQGT